MIVIHYHDGRTLQGVVLAFTDGLVRVALQDSADAAEYRLIRGRWVSEECDLVRIHFVESFGTPEDSTLEQLEALFPCPTPAPVIQRVM
jgi:hypothetical protein